MSPDRRTFLKGAGVVAAHAAAVNLAHADANSLLRRAYRDHWATPRDVA